MSWDYPRQRNGPSVWHRRCFAIILTVSCRTPLSLRIHLNEQYFQAKNMTREQIAVFVAEHQYDYYGKPPRPFLHLRMAVVNIIYLD